jgi:hypothetical protein
MGLRRKTTARTANAARAVTPFATGKVELVRQKSSVNQRGDFLAGEVEDF